jgi:hypothetical protein
MGMENAGIKGEEGGAMVKTGGKLKPSPPLVGPAGLYEVGGVDEVHGDGAEDVGGSDDAL